MLLPIFSTIAQHFQHFAPDISALLGSLSPDPFVHFARHRQVGCHRLSSLFVGLTHNNPITIVLTWRTICVCCGQMKTQFTCPVCGNLTSKEVGAVNRAKAAGLRLFCGRVCAGIARRSAVQKTDEQRRADKALYDAKYRAKRLDVIKARKKQAYLANPPREREAAYRKAHSADHLAYCNTPEYRAWKREYDKVYRAKQEFGEFWESAILMIEIHRAAVEKAGGAYELMLAKGYFNRSTTKRKRDYERLDREEPEIGSLGDTEFHQRW